MTGIKKISGAILNKVLEDNKRQYLVGNLQQPQIIEHIHDENVEVGISHYKLFTADKPHIHSHITEYQFILKGKSEIKNLNTNEVIPLEEGDFYIVKSGTPYAQKSSPDTKIIFFKHPSKNDKVLVEIDEETKKWLSIKI